MKFLHAICFNLAISSLFLTACGQDKSLDTGKPAARQVLRTDMLQGAVSSNTGLIKTGTIKLLSEKGHILASTTLENSPRFQIDVPADTALPVILGYYDNVSPEAQLISVVIHPDASKYDINPATTAIAKQAKAMGGYTHSNMVRAAENSVHVPDANKTTSGFRGDPTTQYGGWH